MGAALRELVMRALEEDRAFDDITTITTVPETAKGQAHLIARTECTIAGLDPFRATFELMDDSISVVTMCSDGAKVEPGSVIAEISGPLRPILSAERTALNFVQHLSGIATLTRAFKEAAGAVEIRDTRKTTPGLRHLEKRAVAAGGGTNHRRDLAAAILIKDNHIAAAGGITEAIDAAKATGKHVEVECDSLEQVKLAADAGADEILLDNMDLPTLRQAVKLIDGRARTEASGGITLADVAAVAATGVDSISIGALTHSAPAADVSLDVR